MMMQSTTTTTTTTTTNTTTNTTPNRNLASSGHRVRRAPAESYTSTSSDDFLSSDMVSDKILKLTQPFQWGGSSATPGSNTALSPSIQSSCSHRDAKYTIDRRGITVMERHHAAYRDEIHEFMKVSLVFNLFQGSETYPVDVRYIGTKCKLPIIRHRLQRLFNRKLIDTIVQFDAYRLLDPHIGAPGKTTIQPNEIRRAWDEGFYDPVHRDIPLILRHRAHRSIINV